MEDHSRDIAEDDDDEIEMIATLVRAISTHLKFHAELWWLDSDGISISWRPA